MFYIKFSLFLGTFFSFIGLHSQALQNLTIKHEKVIFEYFKLAGNAGLFNHQNLQVLFKTANQADLAYLKCLMHDKSELKKIIKKKKKNKEDASVELDLFAKLDKLYKFLRKYSLELQVTNFLNNVRDEWKNIFEAVDKGQDILPLLSSKGINKPGINGLKIFITKMNRFLDKVNDYENRIHADFIDLKLSNYVLKIELIRMRNAAIFHPLYRGTPIVTNYPR